MTTMNPFDLLDGVDNEDTTALLAAAQLKIEKEKDKPKAAAAAAVPPPLNKLAKQKADMEKNPAGRDYRNDGAGREGGRGGGRGYGRGRGGGRFGDSNNNDAGFGNSNGYVYKPSEEGGDSGRQTERRSNYGGPRGGYRGGRRGEETGEGGDRPRRMYDRRSGSGRGNDIKRDGSGSGNWGTPKDEISPEAEPNAENEANATTERKPKEEVADDANKDSAENEEKEAEDKEMTLEEYMKFRAEQGKLSVVLKTTEQRKVDAKEFASMQQISSKKENDEIFAKLGSDKDKKKEAADKEEKAKKAPVSINEFLKPAEGDNYYRGGRGGRGGRGRGAGRGPGFAGGAGYNRDVSAPSIEDPGQFPSLGGK